MIPLRSVRSRAEVIVTHMSSMSDVCETHAQSVEKPIASLATSALLTHVVNILGSSLVSIVEESSLCWTCR
jgi:hypothetical protein